MVNLTRIYTRTGDDGTTALGDFSRTSKTDPRLAAYADTNEANAHLGVAIATGELDEDVVAVLTRVQNDLFDVGADLATPLQESYEYPPLRVSTSTTYRNPASSAHPIASRSCSGTGSTTRRQRGRAGKARQNPRAHGHWRGHLEDAEHIQRALRAAQI